MSEKNSWARRIPVSWFAMVCVLAHVSIAAQTESKFPLHDAVSREDAAKVQSLIQSGADVNLRGPQGATPLHLAAVLADPSIAIALIEAGADVKSVNAAGQYPLHLAAYQGRKATVISLIEHGAPLRAVTPYKETAVHYAARGGRKDVCIALMARGLPPSLRSASGRTALHESIYAKKPVTTAMYLKFDRLLNAKDNAGLSPVEAAVSVDFAEMVWPLIDAYEDKWTVHFDQAFSRAVELDKPESMTQLLSRGLERAKLPSSEIDGLHRAAELRHDAVLRSMLDAGMDPDTRLLPSGWAPVHMAATAKRISTIETLHVSGADLDARTARGETALQMATRLNLHGVIRKLLALGADPNAADYRGRTPLHFAVNDKRDVLVKLFVEKGANVDAVDENGVSPLLAAHFDKNKTLVDIMRKDFRPPMPKFSLTQRFFFACTRSDWKVLDGILSDPGFDPNGLLPNHLRPIHAAAGQGDVKLIDALLDKGADLNDQRNYPRWTPLHYAVNGGRADAVQALLKRGADPNLADVLGVTPMHLAGRAKNVPLWDMLLAAGGDQSVPGKNGATPADLIAMK